MQEVNLGSLLLSLIHTQLDQAKKTSFKVVVMQIFI